MIRLSKVPQKKKRIDNNSTIQKVVPPENKGLTANGELGPEQPKPKKAKTPKAVQGTVGVARPRGNPNFTKGKPQCRVPESARYLPGHIRQKVEKVQQELGISFWEALTRRAIAECTGGELGGIKIPFATRILADKIAANLVDPVRRNGQDDVKTGTQVTVNFMAAGATVVQHQDVSVQSAPITLDPMGCTSTQARRITQHAQPIEQAEEAPTDQDVIDVSPQPTPEPASKPVGTIRMVPKGTDSQ